MATLPPGLGEALNAIFDADTDNFVELTHRAGIDPARDFVGANLNGVDLSDCDLAGFNFARCRLHAITWNDATSFAGCNLEGATFDPGVAEHLPGRRPS
jgi:uncharacterized protein YjbI with pentapeptide repeats